MAAADQTGVAVDGDLADNSVGDGGKFARLFGVGEEQVNRTGEATPALGTALLADRDAEGFGSGDETLHGRGPGIVVRNEVAVGHLRRTIHGAGDLKDIFHA